MTINAFPEGSFPSATWPDRTWPLTIHAAIPYTEIMRFDVEMRKVATANVELAKVVSLTAYAELEDNS